MSNLPQKGLLSLTGILLFACLFAMFLFGRKRQTKKNTSPVARHTAEKQPDDALKYWTDEQKRKAGPAPMPHVGGSGADRGSAPDTSRSE